MLPLATRLFLTTAPGLYFAGRQVCHLGINTWKLLKEIVPDFRFEEIHVCLIIGIVPVETIAPVVFYLITVYLFRFLLSDQDIRYKIISVFLS